MLQKKQLSEDWKKYVNHCYNCHKTVSNILHRFVTRNNQNHELEKLCSVQHFKYRFRKNNFNVRVHGLPLIDILGQFIDENELIICNHCL